MLEKEGTITKAMLRQAQHDKAVKNKSGSNQHR
jgi:hypothetical protein